MKQILQNLSTGETTIADIPCPKNKAGSLLISTRKSLVSSGTERMLINFSKSNLLDKALSQPEKVKMTIDKISNDGLFSTIDAVRSKLNQPLPLGYCNVGTVIESSDQGFEVGDRVVSNGPHAEVVSVPRNLCAKIPETVDDESASFTVIGAIGLQGVRLLMPTIGECFVVSGLGLVGLLCVQILRANGCRVLGIDFDSHRCELARSFGAETVDISKNEDPLLISKHFSRGVGVDGVLIAASSKSNDIIHQATEMCRIRGRIVLIGVVGLNLQRDDFYKKELSFQVSMSYGPGRYDPNYEQNGNDYPLGYVRWTEQRNFEAILDMMSSKTLNLKPLISQEFDIEDALEAYSLLDDLSTLGVVLNYPDDFEERKIASSVILNKSQNKLSDVKKISVGFIGAGNFSSRVLIPGFKEAGAHLHTLVSFGGVSSTFHGNKNNFIVSSTNIDDIWNDQINTVVIATQHGNHASQVIDALNNSRNVYVEKPLALTLEELESIKIAYQNQSSLLMVGFNRRFAPHIIKMKELLDKRISPKIIIMTINSGFIPKNHWTQNLSVGGGRIIGEACHFIDLMIHLTGSSVVGYNAIKIGASSYYEVREDKVSISLNFKDGSIGTIHYLANGSRKFPKERIEVFCESSVLQLDNFRLMKGYGWNGFNKMKLFKQDKGQKKCIQMFLNAIKNGKNIPIEFDEIIESSRLSIEISNFLYKKN